MKNTNKKTCFVPRSLLRAIRANDPEKVRSTLPPEPNPLELIEALLTENDQVGVALVAECHQEITSPDPDVVDSLHRLGEQITKTEPTNMLKSPKIFGADIHSLWV